MTEGMKSDYDIQREKEDDIACWCVVLVLAGTILYGLWRLAIETIYLLKEIL